jgi:hypothetical protein
MASATSQLPRLEATGKPATKNLLISGLLSRPTGYCFGCHRLQHFLVYIGEFLDVDAAFTSGVLAEFR